RCWRATCPLAGRQRSSRSWLSDTNRTSIGFVSEVTTDCWAGPSSTTDFEAKHRRIMDSIIKDIRYAIRGLMKRPGFVAIAVITLALGIGANTAIFSLVNTVVLRSLPVDHPNEIVSVAVRGRDDSMSAFSYPNYKDFRDRNDVL